ncbi:hypothetical protein BBJ28_00015644 [Nothophytophthora sp. Chile5]|nr:hypothetical protein BBJ28_00015644 [Nothophytophthora sp. Chile5]
MPTIKRNMATMAALRSENTLLRDQLRVANLSNARKDSHITALIAAHHREKMVLLRSLEERHDAHLALHQQLVQHLQSTENCITTAPHASKVHGFALTITPVGNSGTHEIRFIAGQASYVMRQTRKVAPDGVLCEFTQTGNPIDLRQNFQREANARLRARVGLYLQNNPVHLPIIMYELTLPEEEEPDIIFRCCRSQWTDNDTPFPLEEVTNLLSELIDVTNASLGLAERYRVLHASIQADSELEAMWRMLFGIGIIPALILCYYRFTAEETESYENVQ